MDCIVHFTRTSQVCNNVINNSVRLDGQIIKTSADLTSVASGPYWNTRQAVGYEYTTQVNQNAAQFLE